MTRLLLTASRVMTPDVVHAPGWVEVAGERIVEVGAGAPPGAALDLGEVTVVPGFVDAHAHGGGGASFADGAIEQVLAAHRATGTTTMVASLVTDSLDRLVESVAGLAPAVADGTLAGIHLEGPWLSARHAGAHDPSLLRDPTPRHVDRLLSAGAGAVRMVTVAPELPGALETVRRLVAAGVVVAIGHTDATYDVTREALDAGARVGTHLFNAMRPLRHREPGPVTALLEDGDSVVELVADGVHVHPAVLRLTAAAKPGRFVLVTDAMAAAAHVDGDYRLGALDVTVRDGVARLAAPDGRGNIAGSTLTSAAAVRYLSTVAGLPLQDSVRAATSTPATLLGLTDVGALLPGRRADLVVMDAGLQVTRVMRAGRWVAG